MEIKADPRERILTQREVAERLRVSLATVRRRCAAGELKVVRLSPRRVGILASEEERYLREREGLPPAA
jgi:excisionase family DNA binding protein